MMKYNLKHTEDKNFVKSKPLSKGSKQTIVGEKITKMKEESHKTKQTKTEDPITKETYQARQRTLLQRDYLLVHIEDLLPKQVFAVSVINDYLVCIQAQGLEPMSDVGLLGKHQFYLRTYHYFV
ncbi:hypothetical protein AtNW77_Chr4g0303451 [Arabidopsis thaliana]